MVLVFLLGPSPIKPAAFFNGCLGNCVCLGTCCVGGKFAEAETRAGGSYASLGVLHLVVQFCICASTSEIRLQK